MNAQQESLWDGLLFVTFQKHVTPLKLRWKFIQKKHDPKTPGFLLVVTTLKNSHANSTRNKILQNQNKNKKYRSDAPNIPTNHLVAFDLGHRMIGNSVDANQKSGEKKQLRER